MSTPINQELRELRMAKEHYTNVLLQDRLFKSKDVVDDDVKLLSEQDIDKINMKIDVIDEKIVNLLKSVKDLKV